MVYEKTMKMTRQRIPPFLVTLAMLVISISLKVEATYREQLCELINENLKLCRLQCPEGRLWNDGCPVCACRNSICEGKCSVGERCTIRRALHGKLTDVAVCTPDPTHRMRPTPFIPATFPTPTRIRWVPSTVSDRILRSGDLGTCDFQGRCDATGRCPSVNSVCRRDGLCCRVKTYNPQISSTSVARCLEEPSVGHCRALGLQYVFNATTSRCESMIFGGCTTSGNSFPTMAMCQSTCEHPCQKPRTAERCLARIPRYFFNEDTEACEMLEYDDCSGTSNGDSNGFLTPWDCETHCKGLRRNRAAVDDRGREVETQTPQNPVTRVKFTPARPTTTPRPEGKIRMRSDGDGVVDRLAKDRQVLTNNIINSFQNIPQIQSRGKPEEDTEEPEKVIFRPRPNPADGRTIFSIDANGNVIYSNSNQQMATPATREQPDTTTATITTENVGGRDALRRFADRYRSGQSSGFQGGQLNYMRQRSRPNGVAMPVSVRGYNGVPLENSYQQSASIIRRYLGQG